VSLSRTQVIYLLGGFAAIVIAVLSSLVSPRPSTATLTVAIFAPLAVLLTADRLSSQNERKENLEAILQAIRTESVNSGSIIALGTEDQWIDYLIRNAQRARLILNTRLSYIAGVNATAHQRIDTAIAEAVQSGTDYHFICSKSREDSLSELERRVEKAKADAGTKGGGKVVAYVFDTGDRPILQMKIFDYGVYSEAMIGFVFQTDRGVAQPIFLVRDQKMVVYFRHVFYTYSEDPKSKCVFRK
jgi:hypothetical protein